MYSFLKLINYNSKQKNNLNFDISGNPCVEIEIQNSNEIIAPFLINGKPTINVEFANLLDNLSRSVKPGKKLHCNIKCQGLSDDKKFDTAVAIKNFFHNRLIDITRKIKSNFRMFLIMLFFSAVFVTFLFLSNFFGAPFIVTEIIDIVTWGFVWEAVDLIAFQQRLYKFEFESNNCIYNMKITFVADYEHL